MEQTAGATGNGRGHALVIGGSMAGLLAARALADHFRRVTVVERDRFPEGSGPRNGVPQARHVHVLLTQGQRMLESLFPGLTDELGAAGAPPLDWLAECPIYGVTGWSPRSPSDLVSRACSRDLLESLIRRRLVARQNIAFLEEAQATDLLRDRQTGRVTGVSVRLRRPIKQDPTASDETLHADLVVDASGRNSKAPAWLAEMGYGTAQETVVNSFLGYASRWYRMPEGVHPDWKVLLIWPYAPEMKRTGVIYTVENRQWIVTLGGIARDYPPTDEAGFMEFARTLRSPLLVDTIRRAEPISGIHGYQRTENRLRHFERLGRWPEGFVVVGDAACAFNPVYGQGMTVAAKGALLLDDHLRRHARGSADGLAQRFQKDLAKLNQQVWVMATGEDYRWPATEGGRPDALTRFMHRYLDQVMFLALEDVRVQRLFLEVLHLVKPSSALMQPSVLLKVLRRRLGVGGQSPAAIGVEPRVWQEEPSAAA